MTFLPFTPGNLGVSTMRTTRAVAVVVIGLSIVAIATFGILAAIGKPIVPTTLLWIGSAVGIGISVIAVQRVERAEILDRLDELTATLERQDGTLRDLRTDVPKAVNESYNDGFDSAQGSNGKAKVTPLLPRPPA